MNIIFLEMINELRIGNILEDREGRICRVEEIHKDDFKAPAVEGAITSLPNNPIPLTEKILTEWCGFNLIKESPFEIIKLSYCVKDGLCLFFNDSPPENTYLVGWADDRFGKLQVVTSLWINSLHEVQNQYRNKTGKELTLKEGGKK